MSDVTDNEKGRPRDGGEVPRDLLSDEEFARLMGAEYSAAGKPVDEVAAGRTWKKIQSRTPTLLRRQPRRRLVGSIAAAMAAVSVATLLWLSRQPGTDDHSRVKGPDAVVPVDLEAFARLSTGELRPLPPGATPVGTQVVFKVRTTRPARVVFAVAEQPAPPRLVTIMKLGAPEPTLVEKDFLVYAYEVDPQTRAKFCAIGVTTDEDERLLVTALSDLWPLGAGAACRDIAAEAPK